MMIEKVLCRLGTPLALLSDNGNDVDRTVMRDVCTPLGIDKMRTTVYKPSTNAAIVRFHRTLASMLAKFFSKLQTDWDFWLPCVMVAVRSTRRESGVSKKPARVKH